MPPYISRAQITKLDALMVERFNVSITMMMELASYQLAEFLRRAYSTKKHILICAGKGNNGGDGIAAARHLHNLGFSPTIFLISDHLNEHGLHHLQIAQELKVPIIHEQENLAAAIKECDVILDCLLGYNIKGAPREAFASVIQQLNESGKPIVACDIPSGVDTDEGTIHEPHIKAEKILFLSLPKQGCKALEAEQFVADIGVPKELYPLINLPEKNLFEEESIVRL